MSSENPTGDRQRDRIRKRDGNKPVLPLYLPARQDLVELHDITVREHGGSLGIRDENALLSALARPKNQLLYGQPLDLFDVAASLAYGIMRSHPFQDGNKRGSWVAAQVTLISNGVDIIIGSDEARDKMFDLANKRVGTVDIADWLRQKAKL